MFPLPTLSLKNIHCFPIALKTKANFSAWPHMVCSPPISAYSSVALHYSYFWATLVFFPFCQCAKHHNTCCSLCLECSPLMTSPGPQYCSFVRSQNQYHFLQDGFSILWTGILCLISPKALSSSLTAYHAFHKPLVLLLLNVCFAL